MEQFGNAQRIHSPEQELGVLQDSVQSTMDRIYGGQSFEQVTSEVQHKVVAQAVEQHVEQNTPATFSNPFPEHQKKVEQMVLNLSPDEDDV